MLFVEIGHAAKALRAILDARRSPRRRAVPGCLEGRLDVGRRGLGHGAHDVVWARRVSHLAAFGTSGRARDERTRLPHRGLERCARRLDCIDGEGIGEVPPLRIATAGGEEGARRRDARVRHRVAQLLHRRNGIARDLVGRHTLIHDLVYERAVGAVLQQSPDEIGEKIMVRAHRRVDAAADPVRRAHRLVKGLAHPVQALELEVLSPARHVQHGRRRVRVVGRELRIEAIRHAEKPARAREIGDIGARLAGEDGKAVEAQRLRALDLAVPIGALDEAHHDRAPVRCGERTDPIDDVRRAFAVGLHHHAEAVPAAERGAGKHRLDDIEREVEAVCLLGVHVETDPGRLGEQRKLAEAGSELYHHSLALAELVARVERRQLDRDPRPVADALTPADSGERGDGIRIGEVVTPRVRLGAGRFAQHVVGEAVALRLRLCGAGHGFAHVAPEHELMPELAHGLGDRSADDRLAESPDRPVQYAGEAFLRLAQHLAGEQQRPGGRVDQRRARLPEMRRPVRRADLVLDQCVDGFRVGHPEQGLGQAHERHALAGRKPVLGEEALHDRGGAARPDSADQIGRMRADRRPIVRRESCGLRHPVDRIGFVFDGGGAHRRPNLGETL